MTTAAPTVSAPPAVGAPAPDLSLLSTGGETVSLASLRGQRAALVAFFPLAFTSTCTAEVCAFSEDYEEFERAGVAVLPVSVDSVPTLKAFREQHGIQTHLLSDFKREASRAWGVLIEERFHSTRAYFLVDREGIVRWAHVEANPGQRRENAEILAEIAKL